MIQRDRFIFTPLQLFGTAQTLERSADELQQASKSRTHLEVHPLQPISPLVQTHFAIGGTLKSDSKGQTCQRRGIVGLAADFCPRSIIQRQSPIKFSTGKNAK